MARATGEMLDRAFKLHAEGMSIKQIANEMKNSNIRAYFSIKDEYLDKGIMPPDKGSAYSLRACREYMDIKCGRNIEAPEDDETNENESENLRIIRASFELGEIAKKAIDGLLALAGVTP